ncbi:metallophosphoesterase family protein [Micromonospora humi]|uniref:Calcineurin-like phosphoesterase superfamily domain-containing protein n=1 Tax=Micromonospora humi TaxID=745366 RepID=A0A1C5JP45_9ACTN|nr:metallophosphoesterase [Micromonospora humi]SCG72372.1 Calcineurin-like phosphoesterase superfamily domain-containing protein [Micromonospora humi]
MRAVVLADLHGRLDALRDIVAAAAAHRPDALVCAGDLLDCLISKTAAGRPGRRLPEVVAVDHELWDAAANLTLVRGNQEERIARLLAGTPVPGNLRLILDQPPARTVGVAEVRHGHGFTWQRRPDGWWQPGARDLARLRAPVTIYGHNHQNACYELHADGSLTPRPIVFGQPLPLSPAHRHLVNVDAARREPPSYVVYDDDARTVTYHRLAGRRDTP